MQENIYLPVNWIDGMKINKSHFLAQDNALIYQLAQATGSMLNEFNYGVLPSSKGGAGLKLFLSTDNQQKVQVRIQECRAITAGGYYIEFSDDTAVQGTNLLTPVVSSPVGFKDLKGKSSAYYVVLTINPYQRVPYGVANPAETPPRLPNTFPFFAVDLVPVADVVRNKLGNFQLPVGKIRVEEQRVVLEDDYIPPSCSAGSHADLLEIHAGLEQFYSKIETYSLQIIQKILQKKHANDMSVIVQKICDQILSFTASQLAEFKTLGLIQAPVYLVSKASALARLIKNILDCYLGSGKEELITYFTEWCNISQGELEGAIVALATHQYDHLDINKSVEKVSTFTKILSQLFHQLARLEYIGKRKDSGIFVKEEVISQSSETPAVSKRRSFLAD
ncbi:MAG TPA: hypothetical protein VNS58_06875 [Puia sp.]|nr:hypothetical protein [Puia sp.]